ncbi:unnamed protein product [Caretta caretta]
MYLPVQPVLLLWLVRRREDFYIVLERKKKSYPLQQGMLVLERGRDPWESWWEEGSMIGHMNAWCMAMLKERTNNGELQSQATPEAKVTVLKDSEHGLKPVLH